MWAAEGWPHKGWRAWTFTLDGTPLATESTLNIAPVMRGNIRIVRAIGGQLDEGAKWRSLCLPIE